MWNAAATCAHRRILLGTIALAAFLAIVPLTQAAGGADRRPPTAPTNLRVTAATVSSVSLAWDASRDNKGGAQFSGYGLYQDGVLVGSATSTTYTFAGLDCGTTATFGVDALDAAGNRSQVVTLTSTTSPCPTGTPTSQPPVAPSPPPAPSDTSPPTVPTGLAVTAATETTIVVSWIASTDDVGVAGYTAYRGATNVGTTSQTTYTFGGLACGMRYTLGVDAYDAAGNHSATATVAAITSACPDTVAPSAPTGLTATNVTATSISLAWTASTDNVGVVGYGVYRNGTKVADTTTVQTSLASLSCGTSYTVGVDAVDPAGNRSAITTITVGTSACAVATLQPLGASGSWNLVFDDEMNGTSVDLTKWRPNWLGSSDTAITKGINDAEVNCYDPKQVTEGGGNLTLSAVQRPCTAENGVTYPYASGMITTGYNKFLFTYGLMEARVWIPPGTATPVDWPGFWASGANWPQDGEIDVMEVLGGKLCWHFHYSGGAPGGCPNIPQVGGWHTFSADWEPGVITFYYDGAQVGQVTSGVTSAPMKVNVNLALSSSVVVPVNTLVDYVRVWQKSPGGLQ